MNFISNTKSYFYSVGVAVMLFVSGLVGGVSAQSAFNQGSDDLAFAVGSVGKGAETFANLVSLATTIAVSLAFLFFFYNLYKFIKAGAPEDKSKAQGQMIWSLVAIIIIVSLWGIIGFVRSVLGIGVGEANDVEVPGTVLNKSRVNP
ncbi:MAG: pilin [Candidatus Kaiserbacteria bacterium]|nr:pilin [Candidatus Kaiserbacteria bacterium]